MNNFTIIIMMLIASLSFAQNNPIDFEPDGYGADWTWTVFENETNPPLEIIDNPDPSGINTSATVAKFTALQDGNPWAGVESEHGVDLGTFEWDEDNRIVKIQVWKSVISDVGIKFATEIGWAEEELKVSNTLTNEWEELTFDFSDFINPPDDGEDDLGTLGQIIIFPDFDEREQDNVIYFDNITFNPLDDDTPTEVSSIEHNSLNLYPNPVSLGGRVSLNAIADQVEVFDLSGKLVLSAHNTSTFYTDDLNTGIFIVRIHDLDGSFQMKKLVVH